MKSTPILAALCIGTAFAALQGPTEVRFWNPARACNGYTLFAARGKSYLIDMRGYLVNTWQIGTNPKNMKTILVDAFNTFVIKDAGINEEMHAMLEEYPNRKIVLTNANDEEKITLGLDSVPYEMFTLKHDPDKIDPRYYETMLQHFGLDRKEVV